MAIRSRPAPSEYNPYYGKYIERVAEGDLLETLQAQLDDSLALIRSIPEERGGFRYRPGKWSIREVLGHVIDAERIFAYRALRAARGDATPLPGFDENAFVANARLDERTLASLAEELLVVRQATLALLRPLSEDELGRIGTASDSPVTPRALAWIIAGHERHHMAILRERYL